MNSLKKVATESPIMLEIAIAAIFIIRLPTRLFKIPPSKLCGEGVDSVKKFKLNPGRPCLRSEIKIFKTIKKPIKLETKQKL